MSSSTNNPQNVTTEGDGDVRDSTGWSASSYNKTASFVYSAPFVASVLSLLDAQPGEKILDIGCGSGEVTLEIEKIVGESGLVVGMDASESMDLALPMQIQALVGDGFDAVFSNAALHWCKRDPLGVLVGARRVLKPGGRLAIEMGGFMNCIGVRAALHSLVRAHGRDPTMYDPWYFPSIDDYVKLLTAAGFEPIHISLTPRITPLTGGLFEWLRLFTRATFLREFDEDEAVEIMKEVEERCRIDCQDNSGNWSMTYVRLRATGVLKEPVENGQQI